MYSRLNLCWCTRITGDFLQGLRNLCTNEPHPHCIEMAHSKAALRFDDFLERYNLFLEHAGASRLVVACWLWIIHTPPVG
jgi:hypothetical protein